MNIRTHRTAPALLFSLALCATAFAQGSGIQLPQASPPASLKQRVGLTDITVEYARPSVKGRQVFGDLVGWGEVWRTGANTATKIIFSTAVKFGGADVPAGEYALFSIPDQKEWTVILNKVTKQWGSYAYDEKNDVARVKAPVIKLTEPVETFTIDINDIRDDSATLNLAWQNTKVAVKLAFDVIPVVSKNIETALSGSEKPKAGLLFASALFYLDHDLDIEKASQWMSQAIEQQPDAFYMYYHQARLLAKKGDKAAAAASARKSIELAAKQGEALKAEYTRLNERLLKSLGQ